MVLRNTNRIETNLNNCVIFSIKKGRLERENLAVVGTGVSSVGSMMESTIDTTVSDGSVARDTSVAVVNASDDSNVVRVAGGVGVVLGKAVGNLTESVGISIRVGLTLAVVVAAVASVADVTVSTVVSTVANGSVARHKSMSVVNASDNSYVVGVSSGVGVMLGKTVGDLAEGVSISLSLRFSVGGNNGQENNGKGLHLSCVQAN